LFLLFVIVIFAYTQNRRSGTTSARTATIRLRLRGSFCLFVCVCHVFRCDGCVSNVISCHIRC
jgi:hypothetical protein